MALYTKTYQNPGNCGSMVYIYICIKSCRVSVINRIHGVPQFRPSGSFEVVGHKIDSVGLRLTLQDFGSRFKV